MEGEGRITFFSLGDIEHGGKGSLGPAHVRVCNKQQQRLLLGQSLGRARRGSRLGWRQGTERRTQAGGCHGCPDTRARVRLEVWTGRTLWSLLVYLPGSLALTCSWKGRAQHHPPCSLDQHFHCS